MFYFKDSLLVPVIVTEDTSGDSMESTDGEENGTRPRTLVLSSTGKLPVQTKDGRIRRKSGDDVLNSNSSTHRKSLLFDAFRPRSKSDISKTKKPSVISSVKQSIHNTFHSQSNHKGNSHSGSGDLKDMPSDHKKSSRSGGEGKASAMSRVMDMFRARSHSLSSDSRNKAGSPKPQVRILDI